MTSRVQLLEPFALPAQVAQRQCEQVQRTRSLRLLEVRLRSGTHGLPRARRPSAAARSSPESPDQQARSPARPRHRGRVAARRGGPVRPARILADGVEDERGEQQPLGMPQRERAPPPRPHRSRRSPGCARRARSATPGPGRAGMGHSDAVRPHPRAPAARAEHTGRSKKRHARCRRRRAPRTASWSRRRPSATWHRSTTDPLEQPGTRPGTAGDRERRVEREVEPSRDGGSPARSTAPSSTCSQPSFGIGSVLACDSSDSHPSGSAATRATAAPSAW